MPHNIDDIYQGQILYSNYSMGSDKRPHRIKVTGMKYNPSLKQIVITAKHGLWEWVRFPENDIHKFWETDEQIALTKIKHNQ